MAAPMRQFLTKSLLQKYHKIEIYKSNSLLVCKRTFILNLTVVENCSLRSKNGLGSTKTLPLLLSAGMSQSCSQSFRGGIRQVTVSLCTSSQFNRRSDGYPSSRNLHQKSSGNFSLALGIGGNS